jgi:calcineurin-like phosphoesterase family protein
MPKTWFTADTHFGHARILEYCKRPFKDEHEMEEVILERFNQVLHKGDLLYHLGDVSWSTYPLERFFHKLNTKAVHLILGNHDRLKSSEYSKFCQWVGTYKHIIVNKTSLELFHYPMRSWNGKGHGAFQLYGHCHGNLPGIDKQLDVGVDTHEFYPYEFEEIYQILKDKPNFSEGQPNDT